MKSIKDWMPPMSVPTQKAGASELVSSTRQENPATTDGQDRSGMCIEEGLVLTEEQRKLANKALAAKEQYSRSMSDILSQSALEAGSLGFMPGWILRAALPYQEPKGNPPVWHRKSFGFDLVMQPGYETREERYTDAQGREGVRTVPVCIGYPYGVYPRLFIAYASTMVVQRKERDLVFGEDFQRFFLECGRSLKGGGTRGSATVAKEMGKRTFATTFSITNNKLADEWAHKKWCLADEASVTSLTGKGADLFRARITLSETFFNSIREFGGAPFDLRILGLVSNSALAMDVYLWLTHRAVFLNRDVEIRWTDLMLQFGSSIQGAPKFRQNFIAAINMVERYYLSLQGSWVAEPGGLVLLPRLKPSVPQRPFIR